MKKHKYVLFLFCGIISAQLSVETIKMTTVADETSGLEYFRGHFLTLNDSGDKPNLYSFTSEGKLIKTNTIDGIINRDWEDLTADENYIYVSDTGNNNGRRKDLTIYRLDRNLNLKDSILISYANQKKFKKKKKNRYNAEALASVDSVLLLFSKDNKKLTTQVYSIPKVPKSYVLEPIAEFLVNTLITAADYDKDSKTLALTGDSLNGDQVLYIFSDFDILNIKESKFKKYIIPVKPAQIEAIKIDDPSTFWLTSEGEENGIPRLFKVCLL